MPTKTFQAWLQHAWSPWAGKRKQTTISSVALKNILLLILIMLIFSFVNVQ
jgi:hypothetical protein